MTPPRTDVPTFYGMDGEPIPDKDWGSRFEADDRKVALTQVGDSIVSTVLLMIDHNFSGVGPPLIFETMIFGSDGWEDLEERYSTKGEALAGHVRIVLTLVTEKHAEPVELDDWPKRESTE